jgi:glycosyltransferase involved in cell wall biosynthesis
MGKRAKTGRQRPSVIVIGPVPPPMTGAAQITRLVSQALADCPGVRVKILNTAPARLPVGIAGVQALTYHCHRALLHWKCFIEVATLRHGAILYVSCPGGLGILYLIPIALVARFKCRRIVVHHHSFLYLQKKTRLMSVFLYACGALQHHVCLCFRMAQLLSRYACAQRISVCSNSAFLDMGNAARLMNPSQESDRGKLQDEPFVLGHLSNLCMEKGTYDVLNLFDVLSEAGANVRLHLAGPATTNAVETAISTAQSRHPGRIFWYGQLADNAKKSFYEELDLFVLPSRNEAEPLVILESAAAGVPSVCYETGCLTEMAGASGLLVSPSKDFVEGVRPYVLKLINDVQFSASEKRLARMHFLQLMTSATKQRNQLLRTLQPGDLEPDLLD